MKRNLTTGRDLPMRGIFTWDLPMRRNFTKGLPRILLVLFLVSGQPAIFLLFHFFTFSLFLMPELA